MWTPDDEPPPTSPSLRGADVHERPVMVAVEEPPSRTPSTRGRFLFALMRRLRELPPAALPRSARAVLIVLADFADASGVAWPALPTIAQTAGMAQNTARKALRDLARHGWIIVRREPTPRTSGRYEVRADGRPFFADKPTVAFAPSPGEVQILDPSSAISEVQILEDRGADSGRQGCNSGSFEVQKTELRGAEKVPDPHRETLTEAPSETPTEAPIACTLARARGADGKVQAVLFVDAGGAREAAAVVPQKRRAGRATTVESYPGAYQTGHADAGGTVSRPTGADAKTLGRAAATHARGPDGEPLKGDAVLAWIRERAADFRRAVQDPEHHRGGYSPFGFLAWLDNGARHQRGGRPQDIQQRGAVPGSLGY